MAVTKRFRITVAVVGVVGAVVAAAFVLWGAGRCGAADHRLRPDDAALVALGQRVYAGQCAACHGMQLEGQANWRERGPDGRLPAPPHDASGHTWHHPDEQLFQITKHGVANIEALA